MQRKNLSQTFRKPKEAGIRKFSQKTDFSAFQRYKKPLKNANKPGPYASLLQHHHKGFRKADVFHAEGIGK